MSADDSASQAQPMLAREYIEAGYCGALTYLDARV